jgi:hypothetical protein
MTHSHLTQTVRYLVLAEASPGLLPRLLQPFAKRDLTPDAMQARRDGEFLRTEILLRAAPAEVVQVVAGNLGQVVGVVEVMVESAQSDQPARIAA